MAAHPSPLGSADSPRNVPDPPRRGPARRRAALAAGLLALAAVAAPAAGGTAAGETLPAETAAAETRFGAIYDLTITGLPVAALTVVRKTAGPRYTAAAMLETNGPVGAFFPFALRARTAGEIAAGGYRPVRFEAVTRDSDKRQNVAIRYDGAGGPPAEVVAEPPFKPKPWQIEPAEQGGTLDPLSAFAAVLETARGTEPCGTSAEIFDGRRRYRVVLGKPRKVGARRQCAGVYRRVAGFKPKQLDEEGHGFVVWYVPGPGGGHRFEALFADTPLGTAALRRRR